MLDRNFIIDNIEQVEKRLAERGFVFDRSQFTLLHTARQSNQMIIQALQTKRNQQAKMIGLAKANGEDIAPLIASLDDFSKELKSAERLAEDSKQEFDAFMLTIPNILDDTVPIYGSGPQDNLELYRYGTPRVVDFKMLDHAELGAISGQMDFSLAAKIAGSRFTTLSGPLCNLHRALIQFMMDLHTADHGYEEVYVPYIANKDSLFGTGQLPKFEEDLFKLSGDQDLYLIPTAEVPVTNLIRDRIIEEESLPLKYVCHTPCFRAEAGSYGKDTHGMIRQHQFEKVELVQITTPDDAVAAHEEVTHHAEEVLRRLDLPFRRILLCGRDTGFSSRKTYDLEVWLPGQQAYREISSCSNFGDFQARRLKARFRNGKTRKTEPVHTINGSGLAVGRTLIAIMENYQEEGGSISIPHELQSYMRGTSKI